MKAMMRIPARQWTTQAEDLADAKTRAGRSPLVKSSALEV